MTASVIGLSGSPKPVSHSRTLLALTLAALERQAAGSSRLVDLAELPADALLGRREDREVADAIQAVLDAGVVVVSTPIYRLLAVDHGLRPLLASVGALVGATAVYGTDAQFRNGTPEPALVEQIERAALEAASLAAGVPT